MGSNDYLISTLLFTNLNKISTGNMFYDTILPLIVMIFFNYVMSFNTTNNMFIKIFNLFKRKNNSSIVFSSNEKDVSIKFRALMHYISQSNDNSVRELLEIELKKYNSRTGDDEYTSSVYRVSQYTKFKITKHINGRVFTTSKEKSDFNGKVVFIEYQNLEISSDTISLKEMIDWVDDIEKKYKEYIKLKMLNSQTLVELSWNKKDNNYDVFYTPWKSNVTFNNRFFTGKNELLEKINFFLDNEQWYQDRGIPYTLGILLWGDPGCGKTGFIKALMNLTKRHGIDIKLSNNFNMSRLKEIIYDDDISEDVIIPQNKRILLFEDIDAMGDFVKDRGLKKKTEDDVEKKICDMLKVETKKQTNDKPSYDNNNLSYFLNILDGLNECNGRIIIMTTNKPEYLDKALIRPGRIDFKINMTKASIDDIRNILQHYWKDTTVFDIPDDISEKISHAEIVNCCRTSNDIQTSLQKILSIKN